jgi:hypothetical protein
MQTLSDPEIACPSFRSAVIQGAMMKKRPNRGSEGSQFSDWPIGLQAHVDRANWLINDETDEAFRSILKPALDDYVADKISADELHIQKLKARAEARATHPGARALDELTSRYEDALENLNKAAGKLSKTARRVAGDVAMF